MTVTIGKTDLEVQLEICKRAAEFLFSSAHHFFGGKASISPDLLDRDLSE